MRAKSHRIRRESETLLHEEEHHGVGENSDLNAGDRGRRMPRSRETSRLRRVNRVPGYSGWVVPPLLYVYFAGVGRCRNYAASDLKGGEQTPRTAAPVAPV